MEENRRGSRVLKAYAFQAMVGLWMDSEYSKKSLENFEQGSGMIWLKILENHPASL